MEYHERTFSISECFFVLRSISDQKKVILKSNNGTEFKGNDSAEFVGPFRSISLSENF